MTVEALPSWVACTHTVIAFTLKRRQYAMTMRHTIKSRTNRRRTVRPAESVVACTRMVRVTGAVDTIRHADRHIACQPAPKWLALARTVNAHAVDTDRRTIRLCVGS